jgi:hypothetical protein
MPSDERMSIDERGKYLRLVAPRYAKAGRSLCSQLLPTHLVPVAVAVIRPLGPWRDRVSSSPTWGSDWHRLAPAHKVPFSRLP